MEMNLACGIISVIRGIQRRSDMEILYRISLGYAIMGITVKDDIVTETPPIAKWMMGKDIKTINAWVKRQGGQIGIN